MRRTRRSVAVTADRPPGPATRLEFWPDYGGALVWAAGKHVELGTLTLSRELVGAATRWLAEYDDARLPWEPTRDDDWLAEGRRLFEALRNELWKDGVELVAGEDHWRP
jgi:hypothetical protein